MSWRTILCTSCLAVLAASTPAWAASKPGSVHKGPTKAPKPGQVGNAKPRNQQLNGNHGYLYVTKGLLPGHRYRIDVKSNGKTKFAGQGFENYTWVQKGRVGQGTKPLKLTGTAPHSFILTPPVSKGLSGWIVAVSVADTNFKPLSVKFVDLGKVKK